MTIVVVGLNYRTAPVDVREKLTLAGCVLPMALADLRAQAGAAIDEAVILSTCNRLEVYVSAVLADAATGLVERFLARLQDIPNATLKQHLYSHVGDDAIAHLMQVACGLDSMILGEAQILRQVTQAYEDAHSAAMTGPILSHLFAQSIHAGKRARTETPISRYTTSVSHAGALLLLDKLDAQANARVLIIGAGEMAQLAAQALTRFGLTDLVFMNRTYPRAEAMAGDYGGRALTWYQLDEALVEADAVICATGAPHTVIHRIDLEVVLAQRGSRPLVIMDIAVPRDVEESVRELPGVQVYDIDSLQSVVDTNVELRRAAIPQVEAIIAQEMARLGEWLHSREVSPVIKTLREWAQSIAEEELAQSLNRLGDADERTRQVVSRMAHRLVNRLLHEPTARLRMQANEGNASGYAYAVRELFALGAIEAADGTDAGGCTGDGRICTFGAESNHSASCNLECILPQATAPDAPHRNGHTP